MGKFDGTLICTDLDGTLLRKDKTVSAENREAIEYFKREGGYFTFITGRMPYFAVDMYKSARPNAPIGCINGGGIYDFEKEKYVMTVELDKRFVELVAHIDRLFPNVGHQINTFDKVYFSKENSIMERFRRVTGAPNYQRAYTDFDNEPVGKVIFGIETEEELLGVKQALAEHRLADQFDFIRSERTLYEILPKGVGKGLAIKGLVDYLGIDPERTIAVGDYNNDISMFKAAGISIAVNNAPPEAKAAARFMTVSNNEHAVARVIYDIEKGVYPI